MTTANAMSPGHMPEPIPPPWSSHSPEESRHTFENPKALTEVRVGCRISAEIVCGSSLGRQHGGDEGQKAGGRELSD